MVKKKKERKWMKLRNKQSFNFDLLLFKKKKINFD